MREDDGLGMDGRRHASPRQPHGNEFSLHSANHKPSRSSGLIGERVRLMLRLKILASAVPLLIAAVFARGDFLPGARPCIAIGEGSVQIASLPWQAQSHVSFTRDPALATVRVQLTDNAAAADFAVLDDVDSAEARWLRGQRGDPLRGDLRHPIGIRARDLSVAGRPGRLPDFCQFEALFGARCRRPHRRRQWRAAPAGRCRALRLPLNVS